MTVHGRTVSERFRGRADWQEIARIKPHLRHIPLVGNGDLATPEDVLEAFARYGVDGVMIGRAALARPWLFRQVEAALRGEPIPPEPTLPEQRQLLLDHFQLVVEQFGPVKAAVLMRKIACSYAQGHPGAGPSAPRSPRGDRRGILRAGGAILPPLGRDPWGRLSFGRGSPSKTKPHSGRRRDL